MVVGLEGWSGKGIWRGECFRPLKKLAVKKHQCGPLNVCLQLKPHGLGIWGHACYNFFIKCLKVFFLFFLTKLSYKRREKKKKKKKERESTPKLDYDPHSPMTQKKKKKHGCSTTTRSYQIIKRMTKKYERKRWLCMLPSREHKILRKKGLEDI
jgi:hypothetical protein